MRRFLLIALFLILPLTGRADTPKLDYSSFALMPVQHDGRLKPLDSFARDFLTMFSGHAQVDGMSATAWLAEVLFQSESAYKRRIFNIPNPAVQHAIDLPEREDHRYSFTEVTKAMDAHQEMIHSLLPKQGTRTLDPAQEQLIALYTNILWYFELNRSVSLVLPLFSVHDATSAKAIGVPADKFLTWGEMMHHRPAYLKLVKPVLDKKKTTERENELLQIGLLMQRMEIDKETRVLRVMPPLWGNDREMWLSPWAVVQEGQGSPQSAALLAAWNKAGNAWRSGDAVAWNAASADLLKQTMTGAQDIRPAALKTEYLYNRADLFTLSLALYVSAFLALLAVGAGGPVMFYRASFGMLALGAALHFIGLAMRIYIMARPPVGTLYESILFVGLVAVTGGLVIEWRTRQGLGLALGMLTGTVLQFIGLRYAGEGDSMGMLVAVLNTNFWLATHVVAITIAYGCCIIAGLLAHFWLLQKVVTPDERLRLELTAKSMLGAALVALLFAMTGTILGGIWADQSWGRFWGWDPKENGALLIVLWLLWLLHGRLSGMLAPVRFALGLALTTVVVALSWFGVNLLGVGLHSYGFTSGIAFNLGLFVATEVAIIGTLGLMLKGKGAAA